MTRIARMIVEDQPTIYHLISRTSLDGFPFKDAEKDDLVSIIMDLKKSYFIEVFGFCVMGNHFHLVVRMFPEAYYSDEEIQQRYQKLTGIDEMIPAKTIKSLRNKWSNLSDLMQNLKQKFSRVYNKRHHRRGTLWDERFKSVIVESGNALIHCLAYIDLNPVRAGLLKKPENYSWNTIGYHLKSKNKGRFLSLDYELASFKALSQKKRVEIYKQFIYDTGFSKKRNNRRRRIVGTQKSMSPVEKKEFTREERFRNRTRYFTDSGIIGSKPFVWDTYQQFKSLFTAKHEKKPKTIKGLPGIYSLKRLAES